MTAPSKPARPTHRETCTACGRRFMAVKSANGRWPKTCSLACQIRKLDAMTSALLARRRGLAELLEREEAHAAATRYGGLR